MGRQTAVERYRAANGMRREAYRFMIHSHLVLSSSQLKLIEPDHGMRDGKAEVHVRRALLHYALERLGLNNNAATRPPQEQQIVLVPPISGLTPGSSLEGEG